MTRKVQVGIVGTSWWTDLMYLPSLKSHPRAEVAAICGRDRGRAEEMARKYGVPRVFTDYREAIERGDLQALVVATPDDQHYPIVMSALEAGLHVLCEKPLANSAAQAQAMYEKAEAAGVKHMVLFTWRWMPHFQQLHRLVAVGYIGRCFHADFQYLAGYGRGGEYAWRFDQRRANGVLGDLGAHMIDLARWYVGDIVTVQAHLGTYVKRPGAEGEALDPANDAAALVVAFANGAQGTIQVSAVAHLGERGTEQSVSLYGEAGTLAAKVVFGGPEAGAVVRGARHGEEQFRALPIPDPLPNGEAFGAALVPGRFASESIGPRLFIDAIVEDRAVEPSFYDGWRVQEVVEAGRRGSEVTIE